MDIFDYHKAIEDALIEKFSGLVETVASYEPAQINPINTPAILLEMDDCTLGGTSDDRDELMASMIAHCIVGHKTPNIDLAVRDFAIQVSQFLRHNVFKIKGIGQPENIQLGKGEFKPGKHGYESWYVSWDQAVYLTESVFSSDGFVPEQIFIGRHPDVGDDATQYEQL